MLTEKISLEKLRDTAWTIGQHYPMPKNGDFIALATQQPRQGCFIWSLAQASIDALKAKVPNDLFGSAHIVRIYDITDIEFNGLNAHSFFDIDVSGLCGRRFFGTQHTARLLMAEVGFRLMNGEFHALARSNPVFFERTGSSGNFDIHGRCVSSNGDFSFQVKNIFDSPVYTRFIEQLTKTNIEVAPVIAAFKPDHTINNFAAEDAQEAYGTQLSEHWKAMGSRVDTYACPLKYLTEAIAESSDAAILKAREELIQTALPVLQKAKPSVVYAQGFPVAAIVIPLAQRLNLPLVISIKSVETNGSPAERRCISKFGLEAILAASRIIVPSAAVESQVLFTWPPAKEKTYVIPDILHETNPVSHDPGSVKQRLHLHPSEPMVLFSGEIAHATGADLLVDAIFQVTKQTNLQFAIVGDGFLKGELEHRIGSGGLGHRVKFVGNVPHDWFESILLASDFVVIPARTWQDEGFAQTAVHFGRPVLTTHQSGIRCIKHGQNGLVTYDNPGSILWGLKELLANPLQGNMMRIVARRNAEQGKTIESAAVEHLICFLKAIVEKRGSI